MLLLPWEYASIHPSTKYIRHSFHFIQKRFYSYPGSEHLEIIIAVPFAYIKAPVIIILSYTLPVAKVSFSEDWLLQKKRRKRKKKRKRKKEKERKSSQVPPFKKFKVSE